MVPASNFRQWPLLLHISTAPTMPPQALQSSCVSGLPGLYVGAEPEERSIVLPGRIHDLSGFMNPRGSNQDLISARHAVSRGPKNGAIHSERTSPSPCSPE